MFTSLPELARKLSKVPPLIFYLAAGIGGEKAYCTSADIYLSAGEGAANCCVVANVRICWDVDNSVENLGESERDKEGGNATKVSKHARTRVKIWCFFIYESSYVKLTIS